MSDGRDIEVLALAGHGAGAVVNALGYLFNRRRGSKLYRHFHAIALGFHVYAIYSHWKTVRER